jgi:hypothetical protein
LAFQRLFSSRDGEISLQRAPVDASNIALWIAQTTARAKIFTARPILQHLLEDPKHAFGAVY